MARCACERLLFSCAPRFFSCALGHCACEKPRFPCALWFFSCPMAHWACEKLRFSCAPGFFSCTPAHFAEEKPRCAGETGHCAGEKPRFSCATRRFPGPRTGRARAKKGVAEATPHFIREDSSYSGAVGGFGSSGFAVLRPRNGWMLNSVSFSDSLPYRCFTAARSSVPSCRPLPRRSCCLWVVSCLAADRADCRARTSSSSP